MKHSLWSYLPALVLFGILSGPAWSAETDQGQQLSISNTAALATAKTAAGTAR